MTRTAVAVLTAVALTGCSSEQDERRSDVNEYIASVNATQLDAVEQWNRVRTAYTAVGQGPPSKSELRSLAAAPLTIRKLRERIAAVTPPEAARRLRARLLRLLDLQTSLAAEVNVFARYVTAVSPLEQRVAGETARLRGALKRSHERGPEQQALTSYATQLDAVQVRLDRLEPPPALAPWHAEQLARVTTLRNGAREASRGLVENDPALIRRGVAALTGAASGAPVTVADRAAVVAYNGRLTKIRAAAAVVAREQARLAQELA